METFYKIVLVDFPFLENPSVAKKRPAITLSKAFGKHNLVVVAFISTNIKEVLDIDILLQNSYFEMGLLQPSIIKMNKLASIPLQNIYEQIGEVPDSIFCDIQKKLKQIFNL